MYRILTSAAIALATCATSGALADELTLRVETDLAALGYDTGDVDGEESMETIIAVSKFQAENNIDVTGEVSPQLAGILAAKVANPGKVPAQASNAPAPAQDPAALKAAQQACLQEKVAAAQAKQKKKRGFGRLLSAVSRTAGQSGNYDIARTTNDVYQANATAADLAAAAEDLGLTEDDVAACQNPPS